MRGEGAVNVGPPRPCPAHGVPAAAGAGMGCFLPSPGVARPAGGARRWFPASPQLLQCAIFSPAESGAGGESWQGVAPPPNQGQLTCL